LVGKACNQSVFRRVTAGEATASLRNKLRRHWLLLMSTIGGVETPTPPLSHFSYVTPMLYLHYCKGKRMKTRHRLTTPLVDSVLEDRLPVAHYLLNLFGRTEDADDALQNTNANALTAQCPEIIRLTSQ
jgi:hypothetical protein